MAQLSLVTLTLVLNTQRPFKLPLYLLFTNIILHSFLLPFTATIPITITNPEDYLLSDDPNITNLMVPQYDCKKQHNLRQFNHLNVKQCIEAPSNIQHASVQAWVYVRAKAKRIKAYKCVAYAKNERKICFQCSVKYRRVGRTVWNHNTMPLHVTLDPLECNIRHLNGTNNKILNNLQYNKLSHFWKIIISKNVWNNSKPLSQYTKWTKCIQVHSPTQYSDLFVTYTNGFNKHTG